MKRNIIILLVVIFSISACKTGEKIKTEALEKTSENYFSLYRSGCYGKCPSYKITIKKDGSFVFIGNSNVVYIGEKKGFFTSEQTNNFFNKLERYKWHSYLIEYPVDNVDFPGFSIEYADGSFLKRIQGNTNAPAEIIALTKDVDAMIKSIDFN